MVAYVNRAQRLMTVAGIPGWFTFDELVDYTVKVDTKVVTENRLADIAGKTRNVPENCDLLTVARRMGISLG